MRLFRVLLPVLAVAASWSGSVRAADPLQWDAAALPPLQLCPDHGFKVTASGACVRVGGSVRTDATMSTGSAEKAFRHDATHLRAEGRVSLDVRQPTEVGPVRAFVSVRSHKGGGLSDSP